jgi:hypothetical protein
MCKKSNISHLTNNICSHGLPILPFVHPNPTIQKSKFKNGNSTDHQPLSSIFIYKKRDERETEKRKKKEIRNKEERQINKI